MIRFKSPYIEDKVRGCLRASKTQILSHEDLLGISFVWISGQTDDIFRRSKTRNILSMNNDGGYWTGFKGLSLCLNFTELIKTDNWEDDLRQFSHIHTFCCENQVPQIPSNLIGSFTKLRNLWLSNLDISDWSFITRLQDLSTIVLNCCGCEGNQAIRYICEVYSNQIDRVERENWPVPVDSIAVIGMRVSDLTPFRSIGERFKNIVNPPHIVDPLTNAIELTELNFSYNSISDISPLSGLQARYLHLPCNEITHIEQLNLTGTLWLDLYGNRIKSVKPIIDKNLHFVDIEIDRNDDIPDHERQLLKKMRL